MNRITGSPSLSCFCLLATGEGVSSTECHSSYGLCISTCARVSGLGNFAQTSSEYTFAKFDSLKSYMTSVHIGPRIKLGLFLCDGECSIKCNRFAAIA